MIGLGEKALMVALMEQAKQSLANVIVIVETMERRDIETIRSLPDQADLIVIQGPEILKAISAFIQRFNRGL